MAALSLGSTVPAAWADGSATPSPSSSAGPSAISSDPATLKLQAQELAAEIQSDGRRLDQMAEAVNAAQIRSGQLDGQLASLQAQLDTTGAEASAALAALKQQAVLSYVVGGAPAVGTIPSGASADPSLAVTYAEILTGGQKRALDAYRSVLTQQSAELQQVGAARRDAAVTLQQLEADRAAASQADAARQQALTRVSGQLAVLVTQIQAAQQAAARTAIQTGTPHPGPAPSTTPSTTPPTTRRTSPSPGGPPAPVTTRPSPSTTAPPRTSPTTAPASGSGTSSPAPAGPGSPQAPGANKALAYARAQLGKPYQWGGAGPDSFDCSGLTMMAWEQAGVYFPHLAQDQYDMTQRIALDSAIPGDLIFFGTPGNVYHVGIYVGNGQMIDAPETGQTVSVQSIYWSDLLGAGRVTG